MKKEGKPDKRRHSGIWSEGNGGGGDFVETVVSAAEMKDKVRTFHMRHDEKEMNFVCKKCGAKISAHNNDWHAGMCDDGCFGNNFIYYFK